MKALLINYNRLTLPVAMANWLNSHGVEPIFIDNGSDYPLLIEYYANLCPYKVVHLGANYGHTAVWNPQLDLLNKLGIAGRYIVTDPDLDLSGIPDDFIEVLNDGLDRYPQFDKSALSLEINDLPNSEEGNFIRGHEAKYWKSPLDDKYFHADTDTTFALYRAGINRYSYSAIRTNRPYTCKHVPWYYLDFNFLSEEEKYYFNSANESSSGKIRLCNK
jgi:hypothetical protein